MNPALHGYGKSSKKQRKRANMLLQEDEGHHREDCVLAALQTAENLDLFRLAKQRAHVDGADDDRLGIGKCLCQHESMPLTANSIVATVGGHSSYKPRCKIAQHAGLFYAQLTRFFPIHLSRACCRYFC